MMTSLFLLGPRAAILIWWLVQPVRWQTAFDSFWVAALGFIFLPFTTLMYVLVAPNGNITGFDWVWLGLALAGDISGYVSGGYGNRGRLARA